MTHVFLFCHWFHMGPPKGFYSIQFQATCGMFFLVSLIHRWNPWIGSTFRDVNEKVAARVGTFFGVIYEYSNLYQWTNQPISQHVICRQVLPLGFHRPPTRCRMNCISRVPGNQLFKIHSHTQECIENSEMKGVAMHISRKMVYTNLMKSHHVSFCRKISLNQRDCRFLFQIRCKDHMKPAKSQEDGREDELLVRRAAFDSQETWWRLDFLDGFKSTNSSSSLSSLYVIYYHHC